MKIPRKMPIKYKKGWSFLPFFSLEKKQKEEGQKGIKGKNEEQERRRKEKN